MNATTCELDVAKRVFQMWWGDAQSGEISELNSRACGATAKLLHR